MRKFKRILIFSIFLTIILFAINKVEATSISISPANPKVGDTVTVTVNVPKVHTVDVTANVSGIVSGKIQVVGGDLAGKVKNYSSSAKYKCNKEGKINVSISNTSTAVLDGEYINVSASKSVNVSKKVESEPSNKKEEDNKDKENTVKSSDATLKILGITPYDFSGFKKATTSYSVSVPNNVQTISIYATASNSKAQVTGTGLKTLKEGKNTYSVKVTAEDKKTTKTYTVIVTRKTKDESDKDKNLSNVATLNNLGVNPKKYDFTGFKMGTKEYFVEVPNNVDEIYIYGYATDDNAKVSGLGSKTLKYGKNIFSVIVTAEDKKTTKTYNITVTRKENNDGEATEDNDKEESDENTTEDNDKNDKKNKIVAGIKSINIDKYELNPEFNPEIYEYTINIEEKIEKLEIKTEPTSKDIEVEIAGNKNLKLGKNIVTILAHNKKDDTTTTYQINVIVGNEEGSLEQINGEIKPNIIKEKKQQIAIIGIAFLIFICLIVLWVIKKRRKHNENYFSDNYRVDKDDDIYNRRLFNVEEPEEKDNKYSFSKYKGKRFK